MKNAAKFLGIITLAAIIGFAMAACENPTEPTHVHQWNAWTVTTAANCTTPGSQTRTCALDATHIEKKVIPIDLVDGHDWGEWEGTVTCTTAGTGTRICSRSATHTETDNNLQPLGHNYQNWQTTTAPTCTTAGEETGTCTHDNAHTTTRARAGAIDPTAHNWGSTYGVKTAATETTNGIEAIMCTYNNSHFKEDTSRTLYATGTTGLDFALISINDGTNNAYRVSNKDDSNGTAEGAIVIPAYHRPDAGSPYLPVTEIGNNAFGGLSTSDSITGITIPEGVTFIGDSAFTDCINLRNIIIDNDTLTFTYNNNWLDIFPASGLLVTFKKNVPDYAFYSSSANTRLTSTL